MSFMWEFSEFMIDGHSANYNESKVGINTIRIDDIDHITQRAPKRKNPH